MDLNFCDLIIAYHLGLKPNWKLPKGFELIFPFDNEETKNVFKSFYYKYYNDSIPRTLILGINPGRFGAGITGVPFTDPYFLESVCNIPNTFNKRKELSAVFIYDLIEKMGGAEIFYQSFYINSICPLGFIKEGKNANYYDDDALYKSVKNKIVKHIKSQIEFGCNKKVAFSLGKGKNYKYFKQLNDEYHFIEKIIPLPHPRWVMQYKLKEKEKHLMDIVQKLSVI